jgi:hypothetical protein
MNEENINKDTNNSEGESTHFSLPENYFDSFSVRLFKKIADEDELKEYPLLTSLSKTNPFTVPANYFESKEELFEYPLLVSLKKNNPFAVPANYFENKEEILQHPLLAANKADSFTVPDTYFTSLTERITHAVSLEQEKERYPLLYSYKKEEVFATPANYFESFSVPTETEATVVPLYKRISKLSYRVAAAVTLLIGLSVLLYTQQNKVVEKTNDCNTFACLDKKDILNSGYVLHASDDNIIDLIDENSLSDSLSLNKDGKTQKINVNDVSDNVDINTLTDNL